MNYPKRFSIGKMYQREKGIYQKDDNYTSSLKDHQTQYQKDYIKQGVKLSGVQLATFYLKNGLPYRGLIGNSHRKYSSKLSFSLSSPPIDNNLQSSQKSLYLNNKEFFFDHEDGEEHAIIAFLIMNKREGIRSKYYRFIQQLPTDVNMLIFWTEDKLKLLQDENLIHKVHKKRDEYYKTFLRFKHIMKTTEEEFQWAYTNLYTRDFGHNLKYKSMVPFCEFFNHECVDVHITLLSKDDQKQYNEQNNKSQKEKKNKYKKKKQIEGFYDDEELQSVQSSSDSDNSLDLDQNESDLDLFIADQIIEWTNKKELRQQTCEFLKDYVLHHVINYQEKSIRCVKNMTKKIINWKEDEDFDYFCINSQKTENFKKGSQVYFNYGRLSNRELLLRYGIALEKNKYDHVYLRINTEELLKRRADRIFQKQYLSIKLKYTEFPFALLKVSKAIKESENQDYYDPQSVLNIINIQTELKGLTKSIELLQEFKAEFKEDLGNSDLLLKDKTLDYDQYFALVYRLEKQRILQHNIILLQLTREILLDPDRQHHVCSSYESSYSGETRFQLQFEYTYRIILKKYLDQILKQ